MTVRGVEWLAEGSIRQSGGKSSEGGKVECYNSVPTACSLSIKLKSPRIMLQLIIVRRAVPVREVNAHFVAVPGFVACFQAVRAKSFN